MCIELLFNELCKKYYFELVQYLGFLKTERRIQNILVHLPCKQISYTTTDINFSFIDKELYYSWSLTYYLPLSIRKYCYLLH